MADFLSKETKAHCKVWMTDAGEGSLITLTYSLGFPTAYQKFDKLWYACGVRRGFQVSELMDIDNITDFKIIWEDVYVG